MFKRNWGRGENYIKYLEYASCNLNIILFHSHQNIECKKMERQQVMAGNSWNI